MFSYHPSTASCTLLYQRRIQAPQNQRFLLLNLVRNHLQVHWLHIKSNSNSNTILFSELENSKLLSYDGLNFKLVEYYAL